jgi:hypothetical protein
LTSTDRVARAVFALLVVACFAAFLITQRLKHEPTEVQTFELTPVFSPTPAGHIKQELISFKLEHADQVTVTIVDSSGSEVATLVRDYPVGRYKQFSLRWNGRRGVARTYRLTHTPDGRPVLVALPSGPIAKPGDYRVEIRLRHQDRTVRSPRSFALVSP